LNYELDTYLDALQSFPDNCDTIQVAKGNAILIKKDIFRNVMWYILPDSNKQYPVTIERVRKIKSLNAQGVIPEELEVAEIVSTKIKEVEPEFVELVGQISLRTLEKADKKRKQKQQGQGQRDNRGQGPRNQGPQQNPNRSQSGQQNPNRPPQSGQQRGPQQNPNRPPQGPPRGPQRPPQPPRKDK
jgi:hypothetical protein